MMQGKQYRHDHQEPSPPPKYTIDQSNKTNWTMRAALPIGPGDIILAEPVLAELNAGLASTYDENRFFSSPKPFNAVKDIDLVVAKMSPTDRASFQALRHGGDTARAFQTNAFCDEVEVSDTDPTYICFRVYKDISRINHSCVPNAVLAYNDKSTTCQVRALAAMQPGEEILIDYLPASQHAFQPRDARVKTFKAHWNFTCLCAACATTDQDELRKQLQSKLNEVTAELANRKEGATKFHLRMTQLLEEYINGCLKLNTTDVKLAEGYQRFSDHQEILARLAEAHYSKPKPGRHCKLCGVSKSHKPHLKAAFDATMTFAEILTKCYGQDSSDVGEAGRRVIELIRQGAIS